MLVSTGLLDFPICRKLVLAPMYANFYGLREEPFRLTPDPRFLHLAQPHRATLEALVHSVVRRKGFVVVSGPIGTGKTTLLHAAMQLLSRLSDPNAPLASAFVLNPLLSRDEFLETLLAEFEIHCSSTSKAMRLAALHKMFLEKHRHGGTSVLIIDEAHLLTVELCEEIRLLSNTDTYREKLLQVILSGQPELSLLLQRREVRALQQRISQYCILRQLSLPETRSYIAERMHAAGLRGPSPFPSVSVEAVHRYSRGVPRVINQVCDAALTLGFTTRRTEIQPDLIEEAAAQLQLPPEPAVEFQKPSADNLDVAAVRSAVDLLVDAMRQRRASALE